MEQLSNNTEIELKSEKARKIIGKMPFFLLRNGILIITLVLFILFFMSYIIPYNEILNYKITFYSQDTYEPLRSPSRGVFMNDSSTNLSVGFIGTHDSLIPIKISSNVYPVNMIKNYTFVNKNDIICYVKSNNDMKMYYTISCKEKDLKKIQEAGKITLVLKNNSTTYDCYLQNFSFKNGSEEYNVIMGINGCSKYLESLIFKEYEVKIIIAHKPILKKIINI